MAHNITRKDTLAYTGAMPWHGIGEDVRELQTAQAMGERVYPWTVGAVPVYRRSSNEALTFEVVPGYVGIQRSDTHDVLSVVTDQYRPFQNAQAMEVVDALIAEGQAVVEVAGSIREGRVCWALAQLPGEYTVIGADVVRPYFLLAWGHDGKHGVAGKLTFVRVVCNNTLTAALGTKWSQNASIYFRHHGDVTLRLADARTALGLVREQARESVLAYQRLACTPVEDPAVVRYFAGVFPLAVAPGDLSDKATDARERWDALQRELVHLYTHGAGNDAPGVRGTAWAAYNAVTEYLDHVYPVRQNGTVSPTRQQSVLFGSKAPLRQDALTAALALGQRTSS